MEMKIPGDVVDHCSKDRYSIFARALGLLELLSQNACLFHPGLVALPIALLCSDVHRHLPSLAAAEIDIETDH